MKQKRTFGWIEVLFDLLYLAIVLAMAVIYLFFSDPLQKLYGMMALVLAAGDAFHLVPRILTELGGQFVVSERLLGQGKMLTSIGMTVFYLMLWQIGVSLLLPSGLPGWTAVVWGLAVVRIVLCVLPQNRWGMQDAPACWNLYRNIPFILLGGMTACLFWLNRDVNPAVQWMWLAIILSFGFYLPVVFGAKRNPKLGMLMLPKSCSYIWIVAMGLGL